MVSWIPLCLHPPPYLRAPPGAPTASHVLALRLCCSGSVPVFSLVRGARGPVFYLSAHPLSNSPTWVCVEPLVSFGRTPRARPSVWLSWGGRYLRSGPWVDCWGRAYAAVAFVGACMSGGVGSARPRASYIFCCLRMCCTAFRDALALLAYLCGSRARPRGLPARYS